MNRTNDDMEFGLVEVYGVLKSGQKSLNNEDYCFGTMSPRDANQIKDNHANGKPWMSAYEKIYFRQAR